MAANRTTRGPGPSPALTRVAAIISVVALCLLAPTTAQETTETETPRHHEEVEVERVIVEVRVAGKLGEPILDLGPEDFRARLGGEPAIVEAVDWIGGEPVTIERFSVEVPKTPAAPPGDLPPHPGRFIVLLFQRDLQNARIVGLAKIMPYALEMVRGLAPTDRVAVLTFGKHLEIYSDFTTDHQRILDLLDTSIVRHRPPPTIEAESSPSLIEYLKIEDGLDAATPEDALELIGDALRNMPGSKSLIFFCWGIGVMVGDAIIMRHNYPEALDNLVDGRTTVFSIDLTQADYHSLEGPLIRLARDTGGFYAKTLYVPQFAVEQVADALAGHYLLTLKSPGLKPGSRRLVIALKNRKGVVYHREYITVE